MGPPIPPSTKIKKLKRKETFPVRNAMTDLAKNRFMGNAGLNQSLSNNNTNLNHLIKPFMPAS